ncbi:MAG: hypothetical protein ABI593_09180, partial [Betaproteobacteria bacterium]
MLAILSLSGVAAFGLAPDTVLESVPTQNIERALALPSLPDAHDVNSTYWREERIQRGDTIGSLLARAGMDDPAAMQFLRTDPQARPLYQLRPGRPVRVAVDEDGELVALKFHTNAGESVAARTALRGPMRRSSSGARADRQLPASITTSSGSIVTC